MIPTSTAIARRVLTAQLPASFRRRRGVHLPPYPPIVEPRPTDGGLLLNDLAVGRDRTAGVLIGRRAWTVGVELTETAVPPAPGTAAAEADDEDEGRLSLLLDLTRLPHSGTPPAACLMVRQTAAVTVPTTATTQELRADTTLWLLLQYPTTLLAPSATIEAVSAELRVGLRRMLDRLRGTALTGRPLGAADWVDVFEVPPADRCLLEVTARRAEPVARTVLSTLDAVASLPGVGATLTARAAARPGTRSGLHLLLDGRGAGTVQNTVTALREQLLPLGHVVQHRPGGHRPTRLWLP